MCSGSERSCSSACKWEAAELRRWCGREPRRLQETFPAAEGWIFIIKHQRSEVTFIHYCFICIIRWRLHSSALMLWWCDRCFLLQFLLIHHEPVAPTGKHGRRRHCWCFVSLTVDEEVITPLAPVISLIHTSHNAPSPDQWSCWAAGSEVESEFN